eukprot:g4158.t1
MDSSALLPCRVFLKLPEIPSEEKSNDNEGKNDNDEEDEGKVSSPSDVDPELLRLAETEPNAILQRFTTTSSINFRSIDNLNLKHAFSYDFKVERESIKRLETSEKEEVSKQESMDARKEIVQNLVNKANEEYEAEKEKKRLQEQRKEELRQKRLQEAEAERERQRLAEERRQKAEEERRRVEAERKRLEQLALEEKQRRIRENEEREKERVIANFRNFTGASVEEARTILPQHSWELEASVNAYFANR